MTDPTPPPCPDCNGVGNILMSTCCGRGCATCPGPDLMLQAVPCWRCKGRGTLQGPAARPIAHQAPA